MEESAVGEKYETDLHNQDTTKKNSFIMAINAFVTITNEELSQVMNGL